MDMWHEAIKGCNLQPVFHFFEKGLDDLIVSNTLDTRQDGPWIAQFFIQLYLLSDKLSLTTNAIAKGEAAFGALGETSSLSVGTVTDAW